MYNLLSIFHLEYATDVCFFPPFCSHNKINLSFQKPDLPSIWQKAVANEPEMICKKSHLHSEELFHWLTKGILIYSGFALEIGQNFC